FRHHKQQPKTNMGLLASSTHPIPLSCGEGRSDHLDCNLLAWVRYSLFFRDIKRNFAIQREL
ncbi:MAG: hypothetical protein ACKO96_03290, partial [Flammeovirgaceae bacterium]